MNPCPGCALTAPGPAACCRDWAVGVTADEVPALAGAVVETAAHGWRYVGELRRTVDGACVFLQETGCGIYDRRPQACRDFGKACRIPGPGAAHAQAKLAPPMAIEWKIPCALCGGRDVEIHASWPSDHHPKGYTHELVVVHWNGDRCYTERRLVELAAAPPDARRVRLAALGPALAAADRRRARAAQQD